jgi:CRISPR-associated endonuclease/helicase Cas3
MTIDFPSVFCALTGHSPFRWQQRLFHEFAGGDVPHACDIPTGLGKTSVMAIWLAALDLREGRLPRRLIYVVDRRAVVDQATEEAEMLARNLGNGTETDAPPIVVELRERLGLRSDRKLAISTLRGQFADNRAWLDDPSAPAIVVGTVDMIGSRLLFSGYGVSRRSRPVHAALLGADALIVLDEAHLVPPFQALIEQVAERTEKDSERAAGQSTVVPFRIPQMRTMALTATGRQTNGSTFRLEPEDVDEDEIVCKRFNAPKWIQLKETPAGDLGETMAARAWQMGGERHRVIVFCNSRKVAENVYEALEKKLGKAAAEPGANLELIVGARRVRERERLAKSLVFRRFAHKLSDKDPSEKLAGPAFLVATSAGEVGVDIDAEHMVCDLVAWERMVQRLGRVNRLGNCPESLVDVIVTKPEKDAETPPGTPTIETCRKPFDSPEWKPRADERRDASPGQLRRLRTNDSLHELTKAATTGERLRPRLTDADVSAWSMTSLVKHTGRPDITPWLRGWVDEETPQTQVLWRRLLPLRETDSMEVAKRELVAFFDAAPPHLSEILETDAYRVVEVLRARAKALLKKRKSTDDDDDDVAPDSGNGEDVENREAAPAGLTERTIVAIVLEQDRSIKELLSFNDIQTRDAKRLQFSFANHRVVIDARLGGLAGSGLLENAAGVPATLDGEPVAEIADEGGARLWSDERLRQEGFRVRRTRRQELQLKDEQKGDQENWGTLYRRLVDADAEETDDTDSEMEWRVEAWVGEGPARQESALAKYNQRLDEHHERARHHAEELARRLALPDEYREMLVIAAGIHDSGKARAIWQRYAGNSGFARNPAKYPPLAKFTIRGDPRLLKIGDGTYRHEFGSVRDAIEQKAFDHLPPSIRTLGLHLVAAHHGNARPVIYAWDEKDALGLESGNLANQLAASFARLPSDWGCWGLIWWEGLLRAVDVAASREVPQQEAR